MKLGEDPWDKYCLQPLLVDDKFPTQSISKAWFHKRFTMEPDDMRFAVSIKLHIQLEDVEHLQDLQLQLPLAPNQMQ